MLMCISNKWTLSHGVSGEPGNTHVTLESVFIIIFITTVSKWPHREGGRNFFLNVDIFTISRQMPA